MKKIISLLLGQLCLIAVANSQTSIGFNNKKDLKQVLSYRLPEWGYTTLILSGHGSLNNAESTSKDDPNRKNTSYNFYMAPRIKRYQESERYLKQYDININISTRYNFSHQDYYSNIPGREKKERAFNSSIYFNSSWKQYIKNNRFILIGSNGWARYQEDSNSETEIYGATMGSSETHSTKVIHNDYSLSSKVGFGVGHLRNITPLLKAARLRERYEALKDSSLISDSEIQFIAQEIAKISGYNTVYDRENKYLWENIFKKVDRITVLSPFEIYYLSDVLHENLGTRFEGWEVSTGLQLNNFKKANQILGWFGQCQWYKNLSLEQQLGMEIIGSFAKFLNDDYAAKFNGRFAISLEYLWVLSDRLLWESQLDNSLRTGKNKIQYVDSTGWHKNYACQLITKFSYYLENHLQFNCSVGYSFDYSDNKLYNKRNSRSSFRVSFGLDYYPGRKLF